MSKVNKKIMFLITVAIFILTGWFYWFQYRPAKMKHDCSWVKETEAAIPAHQVMSEEELREKGLIKECPIITPKPVPESNTMLKSYEQNKAAVFMESCQQENQKIIDKYRKSQEEVPSKETWRKAKDEEYRFCLRDKGL